MGCIEFIYRPPKPDYFHRLYQEGKRINGLWYPRPKFSEDVRNNPEVAERIFQLLKAGYKVEELDDWFRLKRRTNHINNLEAKSIWEDIKACYNYRCAYCDKKTKNLTRDHVIAISKGGHDTMFNIVPACFDCNRRKQSKNLLDWPKFHSLQLHLLGFNSL